MYFLLLLVKQVVQTNTISYEIFNLSSSFILFFDIIIKLHHCLLLYSSRYNLEAGMIMPMITMHLCLFHLLSYGGKLIGNISLVVDKHICILCIISRSGEETATKILVVIYILLCQIKFVLLFVNKYVFI